MWCSARLNTRTFTDDTNFFYSHKNIKDLFCSVNSELEKISQWFKANKLSIKVKKTNFTLFHENSFKGEIPLKLPTLMIGNNSIKRKSSIKFLGVMLDEHISWIDYVRTVENKIAKSIGLLHLISQFLNEDSLKTEYFSCVHSYFNYANIAWASTYATKSKRVYLKQKHAVHVVFNKDKLIYSKPLFENLNTLNVYQINIYQHFMHKFINNQIPSIFSDLIKRPDHKYPTNFSQSSFYLKRYSVNSTDYSISIREPKLWNNVKSKLSEIENETNYS